MNISFDIWHFEETSPLSPEITRLIDLIVAAGSAPLEELHRTYGGKLPEEVKVQFMRGPVGRKVRWENEKLTLFEDLGMMLVQGHGLFIVILGLGPLLRITTLHEYMHVLGHFKEGFVKKAVEDFIKYHRWKASV